MSSSSATKSAPAAPEKDKKDENEKGAAPQCRTHPRIVSDGSGVSGSRGGEGSEGSAESEQRRVLSSGSGAEKTKEEDEDELHDLADKFKGTRLDDEEEEDEEGRKEEAADKSNRRGDNDEEEDNEDEYDNDDTMPNLRTVARWIKNGETTNVLVLSGAGVSCSAGIPDFRTPGTGLYDNLQRYNLPYPEAIFDLTFYRHNTDPFVSLASEIWPGLKFSPTLTHSFVALLERRGLLLRNYTQNIDGLENLGGVSDEKLVECHGHFRSAKCVNCFKEHDGEGCRSAMVEERAAPRCSRCGGPVKPDIVFFGEGLPDRFGRLLRRDLEVADMIIVMGTSLTVAPVSMIPEMVDGRCRRVLLNRELVGDFRPGYGGGGGGGGGRGRGRRGHTDVFVGGDCDESVVRLCRMLGWEEELREMNEASRLTGSNGDGDDDDGRR